MDRFAFGKNKPGQSSNNFKPLKTKASFSFPKIKVNKKVLFIVLGSFLALSVLFLSISYFFFVRPALAIMQQGKKLKDSTYTVRQGLENLDLEQMKRGLSDIETGLSDFKIAYEANASNLRKLPKAEIYYNDSQHLIKVAEESVSLGNLVIEILEPHAVDLGFKTAESEASQLPAQDRVIKLMRLMPQFSPKVTEISERMKKIDQELTEIDPSDYPTSLPWYFSYLGIDTDTNARKYVLEIQSISKEVANKAPQMEAFFNAVPEFMGLNTPKRYLILMANNYEMRMSGGFNTYIVGVEFKEGIPEIFYSIDTYFIDEGDRTGNSLLVNRNVPYHLRNYLYLSGNTFRWYARDATSNNVDFPLAVNDLLTQFWRKDRSLPQDIDGVMQINNDLAVDILKAVGPVNTQKYSIRRDDGTFVTIPVTEFSADNVIKELEVIAGGKLAQTIGRKEIIKYLGQSILTKMYTSEATNLLAVIRVILDSLSNKDIMIYAFDANVALAFDNLGYSGKIRKIPNTQDYLHVSRSNYGAGKADWTLPGFVTQEVDKKIEVQDGKKISTVSVTIKNPKRPDWYNIDPCCFYNAYMRVYVPLGSKMLSVTASDGQDPRGASFDDQAVDKTYIESFTRQQKETDLVITYVYELPDTIDLDNYQILVQKQSGVTNDPYRVSLDGIGTDFILNSDREVTLE